MLRCNHEKIEIMTNENNEQKKQVGAQARTFAHDSKLCSLSLVFLFGIMRMVIIEENHMSLFPIILINHEKTNNSSSSNNLKTENQNLIDENNY